MTDYIKQNGSAFSFPANGQSWVILSDIEKRIKEKIEKIGKPLKEWDINIYRGILTGCNEAFIIDKAKRDVLISKDPKSAEIIRPILRGRDIARYQINFANLYLINTHNGIQSKNIPPVDIEEYPAVKEHLDKFWTKIENRDDQGITPYNLRSCVYMDDFFKQKIVWIELVDRPNFAFDKSGFLLSNTAYFINGENIYFLVAYLNSSLCDWQFGNICATSGAGTRRWIRQYIEQICVPIPNKKQDQEMKKIIDSITDASISKKTQLMLEIDMKIFKLFNLGNIEIKYIQESIKNDKII